MAVTILIPTALRQYAGGSAELSVEARTVGEALEQLTREHAELRKHLFNEQNKLRNFVNVYVNDEDIRHRSGLETPVRDGDTVMIVPSIAGGATIEADLERKVLPTLTKEEIARYSRHLIMPEVGMEGQRKLKAASVLMIGTGGLGAPLGLYLAAAGVGRLGVVDFDVVDESNLQRQVIHGTRDVGRPKIESARDRLQDINPYIKIETYNLRLTSENALELFRDYDIIVDGTDNFPTRYLVNDACVLTGKPNVYGSIFRFEGQVSVFWAARGACYRCLYPEPPPPGLVPSCAEGGVLGVLPGIVGAIQANEVIKLILGGGEPLINRLLLIDAWRMRFRELKLRKDPNCPVCGPNATIKELIDYEEFCGLRGQEAAQPTEASETMEEITARELKERLDRGESIQIIDVREPAEYEIARLPGAKLIPLKEVVNRMGEIDPHRETVVHCKSGVRSAKAIEALKRAGFSGRLLNLKGGITAWSDEVDPSVPKY
ncbi:ubiquitin-like small modifier protein 1 [Pyrinomonas methylaliphatogenes]|jgi:adenylyltransferase/sulfurtransferase|uniref:Molybdopterin-synthase adenylyltransferase n=1 Tax=Pyrinomonas methylaliphatogenes TaxID=454194 RepID=A0A0B6WY34_9BACT|nr:MoaD family protein [Pyrinomonas methylaliphatogenes]